MKSSNSRLFSPVKLRGLEIPNRIVISPMCQYSAHEGFVNNWHLVQLGRYALGGAGLVFVEASAVTRDGRITHGDLGIWSDDHIPGLRNLANFLREQGSVAAIQLGHAGRKGSAHRPWEGGEPLKLDINRPHEAPWQTYSASSLSQTEDAPSPSELSLSELARLKKAYLNAAKRALEAGFDMIELHCGHGYLLHQFLSPISNKREDRYGGDRSKRFQFPLEVVEALRSCIPDDMPLVVRISVVDSIEGGLSLEDSIEFSRCLKSAGVDLIDCSSGGIRSSATAGKVARSYGFQVPFSDAIRNEVDIPTMAVGLIVDAKQAEEILKRGQADLIAIGREALYNPNWALHAEKALETNAGYSRWPKPIGWWLDKRDKSMNK